MTPSPPHHPRCSNCLHLRAALHARARHPLAIARAPARPARLGETPPVERPERGRRAVLLCLCSCGIRLADGA